MKQDKLRHLVASEVASIGDPHRRAALQAIVVSPTSHQRSSVYVDGSFTCWVVGYEREGSDVLVYCDEGPFGDPWGCLDAKDGDLGQDAQWFVTLDDAFIFGMWDGPLPPGYEVQ